MNKPTDEHAAGDPGGVASFKPVADADEFVANAIHIFGKVGWKRRTALAFDVKESTVYRWTIEQEGAIPHYARSAMAAWRIVFDRTGMRPPLASG
jgi:DNA invertase Pin-like site-specific DNA recombinase